MESLSLPVLVAVFAVAAGAVWWAGVRLANATDTLERGLGLGEAMGGLVLLAIATNLPEIAIVVSAALGGSIDIATGNLLGGIAVQTLVLALLDFAGGGSRVPLTSRTRTLEPVIEATMVIGALTLLLLGSQVDPVAPLRIEPAAVVIVIAWLVGLQAVRLDDHQMAISDIFGGNAFLPTLFLLAGMLSGQAVIAGMTRTDLYLAALGIIVTCLYLVGLVYRNRRQVARMGYDSLLVVIVYVAGVVGLVLVGG